MNDPNVNFYGRVAFDGVTYCPFQADATFQRFKAESDPWTALPVECLWVLYTMGRQSLNVPGDFWECGVDRGGSARLLANIVRGSGKRLHLFDTFSGMPAADPSIDYHSDGDFPGVPLEFVRSMVGDEGEVEIHAGLIPDTFEEMADAQIAFAHVDVDLYESTKRCCEFIYPRLSRGGVMVIDDYGRPT